jgi:tetratricopeptide (TPR) repeat protein
LLFRFLAIIGQLRRWTGGSRTRGVAVAASILLLIATTIAGWAYLASVALRGGEFSLDAALAALDQGRYEEARTMVSNALRSGRLQHSQYGGPLYVLGAIKTNDAENNSAPERRRTEYLVASRYLKEARAYGLPAEREVEGLYLLGLSLLESNQFDEGIQVLDDLLADKLAGNPELMLRVHRLLADTCLFMSRPNLDKSLGHIGALLTDADLSAKQRADVLLDQANCLARLHRFDAARQALAAVPAEAGRRAGVLLLQGRIALDEIDRRCSARPILADAPTLPGFVGSDGGRARRSRPAPHRRRLPIRAAGIPKSLGSFRCRELSQ